MLRFAKQSPAWWNLRVLNPRASPRREKNRPPFEIKCHTAAAQGPEGCTTQLGVHSLRQVRVPERFRLTRRRARPKSVRPELQRSNGSLRGTFPSRID